MELITAVALFAIFSLVVLVGVNPLSQYQKAQDAKRKNDLAQLARAIELYYGDHGMYPCMSNFQIAEENTCANGTGVTPIAWGNAWQPYIDLLPKDPAGDKKYLYQVSDDRQQFKIYTALDRKTDPSTCHPGTETPCNGANNYCSSNGSATLCNFGLTSPNTTP